MEQLDDAAYARLLDPSQTSEDELFAVLGSAIAGREGFGGDLVDKGRATFQAARGAIRSAICPALEAKPGLRALVTSANSGDAITGAGAIGSLLAGIPSLAIYSGILGVIVLRVGVRSLCPNLAT